MATIQNQATLSVIDYNRIISTDNSTSAAERTRLFRAFHDAGFAYLKHPFSEERICYLFGLVKTFFDRSEERKIALEGGEKQHFHGWFSPKRTAKNPERSDQKEAFGLGDDNDPTRPNVWPEDMPELRQGISAFFEECHNIQVDLLKALASEVGMKSDTLLPSVAGKDHFCALLYYPETTISSFKDRVRAAPHTDFGTLTLLFNDSAGGLQVRGKDKQWVDAPPMPGHAIVNVADLLSRWFNGTIKSTEHRVVEPPTNLRSKSSATTGIVPARYAISFFGHPNRDALVEPLEECCTKENPKRFNGVYAGQHVKERFAQLHKDGYNAEAWTDDMQRKQSAISPMVKAEG